MCQLLLCVASEQIRSKCNNLIAGLSLHGKYTQCSDKRYSRFTAPLPLSLRCLDKSDRIGIESSGLAPCLTAPLYHRFFRNCSNRERRKIGGKDHPMTQQRNETRSASPCHTIQFVHSATCVQQRSNAIVAHVSALRYDLSLTGNQFFVLRPNLSRQRLLRLRRSNWHISVHSKQFVPAADNSFSL